MSKQKSIENLNNHKVNTLSKLDRYLDSLISSNDQRIRGKADKLCYWLEDYIKFLEYEPHFDSSRLRRYKRGEIIKVHLGYNIGSEEGGLHYCIVIDKNNSIHSPVVTIIPLKSVKSDNKYKQNPNL